MSKLKNDLKNIYLEVKEKLLPENVKKDINILGITGKLIDVKDCYLTITDELIEENSTKAYTFITYLPTKIYDGCTNLHNAFSGFLSLQSIDVFDTSKATDLGGLFRNCYSLISIPTLDTSNVTIFDGICFSCTSLVTVPIFNMINATSIIELYRGCDSLSNESLNNIMASCLTITEVYTGEKTLKQIGLSKAQADTCKTLSNYTSFVENGWTTGYETTSE